MMEEVINSKVDVKLYRRFPDEGEKEVDYGPGYLKLYTTPPSSSKTTTKVTTATETTRTTTRSVQVVFRSHGTMKVRANHILRSSSSSSHDHLSRENDSNTTIPSLFLDTSFENELRYEAKNDIADLIVGPGTTIYGKEIIQEPQTFPISYEFESEEIRDGFVDLLKRQLLPLNDHEDDDDSNE